MKKLIDDFSVPRFHKTNNFVVKTLGTEHASADYEAVMSSIEHLRGKSPCGADWPSPDLTLEQNLKDIAWHEDEFEKGISFAYAVFSPNEADYMGCVYIMPSNDKNIDAEIWIWLKQSEKEKESLLETEIREWILNQWPLDKTIYPNSKNG